MRATSLLLVCPGVALAALASPAVHADDAPFSVVASGPCPDAVAVRAVLGDLLPVSPPAAVASVARVSDLGDVYTVEIGDAVKTYADPARDCAERARVAAAFISLVLGPSGPPPPPSAKPPDVPPVAPPSPPRTWLRLDGRGTFEGAPESGLYELGVVVALAVGRGRFGGEGMCGWAAGSSIRASGGEGSILVERLPCALGPLLRLTSLATPVEVNGFVGLDIGALHTNGTGFARDYDAYRLELGVRASVDATLHVGRHPGDVAPVIGATVTYDPMTYDLSVTPRGVIGHSPSVWAGLSAGVSWSLP